MASNGQRQTLEQNETNEGLSVPDTWEQSMPRDEDPATAREGLRLNADALRKALDGLRLTPTPGESPTASPATPAVQETVSRSSFTDVGSVPRTVSVDLLSHALHPSSPSFDAELRRAWLRLDKQTRREIHDHWQNIARPLRHRRSTGGAPGAYTDRRDVNDFVDKFAQLRSMVMARAPPWHELPPRAEEALNLRLMNRLSDALNPLRTKFDAELRRAWLRLDRQTRLEIKEECALQIRARSIRGDHFALLRSLVMSRALPASIDEEAPLEDRLADVRESPETEAQDELDDDLLREIAFDDGRRPRQMDEASEVSGVTVSSRATFASRATSAYTAVPTAHGATRMQQRAVALRDLQAAKKYGTITRAHDGARGDKRWKIEYGGLVYITDEQQKLVITTYQFQPRVDSIYIGPDPPPPTHPPPIYMPPALILAPIVEGPIPLFQPPPPPTIVRSTARPVAPPEGFKICAACGKSFSKAAFSGTQWRSRRYRRRCNVCVNSGWRPPAEVKAALLKAAYPPLPDDG